MYRLATSIVWLLAICAYVSAFFPGLMPVNYCNDSSEPCTNKINVYVNPLESNEINIPLGYGLFDFCTSDESETLNKNAIQILFDRVRPGYDISYLKNEKCKTLCTKKYYPNDPISNKKLFDLRQGIHLHYYHRFIVDDIPVKWCCDFGSGLEYCNTIFPMGCQKIDAFHDINVCNVILEVSPHALKPNTHYIFNHFEFTITYQSVKNEEWGSSISSEVGRITGIKLKPKSIKHEYPVTSCDTGFMEIPMNISSEFNITYTYSVKFEMNNTIKWISRWNYIKDLVPSINIGFMWLTKLNSYIIFIVMFGMVPLTTLQMLHNNKCYQVNTVNKEDQHGCIIVHENIKNMPPKYGMLLSIIVGCGLQIVCISLVLTAYLLVIFERPISNLGLHMINSLALIVCLGVPAGFASSMMYNRFDGKKWVANVILTAMFLPGVVFGLFFFKNLNPHVQTSGTAIPFSVLLSTCFLWFCLSIPFTFIGAVFSFRKIAIEHRLEKNNGKSSKLSFQTICKQRPKRRLYDVLVYISFVFQLYLHIFIFRNNNWDYLFLYLLLDFLTLVVYSENAVGFCYFNLCIEDFLYWLSPEITIFVCCFTFIQFIRSKLSFKDIVHKVHDHSTVAMILFFIWILWFVRKEYRKRTMQKKLTNDVKKHLV